MKYIKENKTLKILFYIALTCLLIGIVFFLVICLGGHTDGVYGNRLDGIKDVEIKSKTTDNIIKNLESQNGVDSVKYNLQGKIVKFTIKVSGLSIDDAKKLTEQVTLTKKQNQYYDIQLLILSDDDLYPLIAYKSKGSDTFSFVFDKVENDVEGESDE